MATKKSGIRRVIILLLFCIMMVPCTALQPDWTYTDSRAQIGDIAIAPDGSTVVAGTGKVLLLARNGTVLAKEPYGEILAQSRDGSTIVTAYSSTVSSTVYLFTIKNASRNPTLQRMWETTTPNKIISFAVSDKGDRVAFSAGKPGITVYNGKTGKYAGHNDSYSALIAMSGDGTIITGISPARGLDLYNTNGLFRKNFDITLAGSPESFMMDTNGTVAVFNTGPYVTACNVSDGAELWKKRSSSDINMLAMTPSGDYIAAGTESGAIELYDANGTLTWTFSANNGTGSGHAIKAVAMTRDGSKIIAGSGNGKILLLDSTGNLLWTYESGKASVGNVAIAADGSLAAAASESTIYAFSTGQNGTPPKGVVTSGTLPSRTFPAGGSSTALPETSNTPQRIRTAPPSAVPGTPTVTQTEYSVVRKATQSPPDAMTGIAALVFLLFIGFRKNH